MHLTLLINTVSIILAGVRDTFIYVFITCCSWPSIWAVTSECVTNNLTFPSIVTSNFITNCGHFLTKIASKSLKSTFIMVIFVPIKLFFVTIFHDKLTGVIIKIQNFFKQSFVPIKTTLSYLLKQYQQHSALHLEW